MEKGEMKTIIFNKLHHTSPGFSHFKHTRFRAKIREWKLGNESNNNNNISEQILWSPSIHSICNIDNQKQLFLGRMDIIGIKMEA